MDRCALFVDAGYVLADGAMAVHGTRRRESVSWDYAGLVQLLSGMAVERSGLPMLRCYWYEATVEGRRSAEHDALADLPGVKLRLAKMRPGRREGVESEIHRDLTTLARNKAVTDAMVVSAEEDLGQVIADVQDLGMRVTLLHIAVDNRDWTISRALRQECDEIVEISSAHLHPYVELITGAEPPRLDERDSAPLVVSHPTVNGHGHAGDTVPHPPAPQEADNPPHPLAFTAPAAAEDQRPAAQPSPQPENPAAAAVAADAPVAESASTPADVPADVSQLPPQLPARPDLSPVQQETQPPQQETHLAEQDAQPVHQDVPPEQAVVPENVVVPDQDQALEHDQGASAEPVKPGTPQHLSAPPDLAVLQPEQAQAQPFGHEHAAPPDWPAEPDVAARPLYGAPVAVPAPPAEPPARLPAARARAAADLSGYNPGAMREQPPPDAAPRVLLPGEPAAGLHSVPVTPASAQVHRLPTRGTGQPTAGSGPAPAGMPAGGQLADAPPVLPAGTVTPASAQPMPAQATPPQPAVRQPGITPGIAQPASAHPGFAQPAAGPVPPPHPEAGQPGAPVTPMAQGAGYAGYATARNGSYTGPRPVIPAGPGSGAPAVPGSPAGAEGPSGPGGQPMGPSGLVAPAGGQQAGPAGQPGPGFGVPNVPSVTAPAGGPAGAVNGIGQPIAYSPAVGGPSGPGGPGGVGGFGTGGAGGPADPLGPAGLAHSGGQPGVSLADAVQSAHQEGQEFGESVVCDAPALWLEAVLARKPRMPSDLEARLLQGSALPIDFLLHDEVRHALRRGFWDALERARR